MQISIEDSSSSLERAQKILAGIPKGFEKAVGAAAKRTAQYVNTESTKAIQERYAVSAAEIKKSGTVTVKYTLANGLQAHVIFRGHKIPLWRHDGASPQSPTYDTSRKVPVHIHGADGVRWILAHPGIPARGHILKSTGPQQFDNAFVVRVGSGDHVGIFERTGGKASTGTDRIREIMGLSNAQMVGNDEVIENLSEKAYKKFDERLDHEISRIINGWGK